MENLQDIILTEDNYDEMLECFTASEIEKAYNLSKILNYPYTNFEEKQFACVYQGDLHIAGIRAGKKHDWNPFNLVVTGNLTVDGDIEWADNGNGSFLCVKGDLKARNIVLYGCPEVHVRGNLDVENGVVGHHGDNGGFLAVSGSAKAKLIASLTYFGMEFSSQPKAITIGDIGSGCEADFGEDELEGNLAGKLWNKEDGYANDHLIAQAVLEGKPVLKASALPVAQAISKKLDKMLEKAEKVTEIDLKDKKLKSIPNQVFDFPNLKRLVLEKNMLKKISPKIKNLTNLEELNLRSCGDITFLPPEIGSLPLLRELNITYNYQLEQLPPEIGNLQNLKKLCLSGVSDLPAEFAKLKNLQELLLSDLGKYKKANYDRIPDVVFEITSLKELCILCYEYSFKNLPTNIVRLTNLEKLSLPLRHTAKCEFPDLPKLKNLKHLDIDGYYCPDMSILSLPEIWNCSTLTTLTLTRWGDRDQYSPDTKKFEIIRPGLEKLPDDAFANMPNLEVLRLDFSCNMKDMPASFYKLENLKEITLDYMKFSNEVKEKIRSAFPNAKIIL